MICLSVGSARLCLLHCDLGSVHLDPVPDMLFVSAGHMGFAYDSVRSPPSRARCRGERQTSSFQLLRGQWAWY